MTPSGGAGRRLLILLGTLIVATAGTAVVTAVVREWPDATGFDQVSIAPMDEPTAPTVPSATPTQETDQKTSA